ncbi:MAG: hypothetical protein ABI333_14620 [bacterium]
METRPVPTKIPTLAPLLAVLMVSHVACGDSGGGDPQDSGVSEDALADAAPGDDAQTLQPLTWSTPLNLSESVTFSDIKLNWGNSIALSHGGTVQVVWREVTDVQGNLITGKVVHRSKDQTGWLPVQDLSPLSAGTGHPKVASPGDVNVYVTWHQFDPDPAGDDSIFVAVSDSSGQVGTFTAPQAIVTDAVVTAQSPLQEMATSPSIAATGDWVYVVWADDRVVSSCGFNVSEVYLMASGDRGLQWDGPHMVTTPDCRSSWTPTVAAADSYVHVAWTDERHSASDCGLGGSPCEEEEYYRRLADHGATPDPDELRLTYDDPSALAQSWAGNITLTADPGGGPHMVHYAWMDNVGSDDFEVYYRRSPNDGASWPGGPMQLSPTTPGWLSARPTIAGEGYVVHVVWMDVQGDTAATISHRWSDDGGFNWSDVSDVTSGTGTFAIQPSVAYGDGRVHVVWNDQAEIWYATSP